MKTIDYYFAPQSPWTYLGHQRLADLATRSNATIQIKPMDLARVFPASGGLPLGQRAPQRQAYRLVELKRFSQGLNLPMHIQPQFFPVAGDPAALLIIAADQLFGTPAAMKLTGAVLAAVWAQQRNIADLEVHAQLLQECNLDAACLQHAQSVDVKQRYDLYTEQAIACGVFGAPSYVINDEIYWGQDRLDFVEKALA